jgi:rhodanese-related sulfurtransferase
MDANMQVDPSAVKAWLEQGDDFSFIDVRMPDEVARGRFAHAEPLDYSDSGKYMSLPKDRKIVFACQTGARSLDIAAYFKGHGFSQAYSLRGGIDAWNEPLQASHSRS